MPSLMKNILLMRSTIAGIRRFIAVPTIVWSAFILTAANASANE